MLFLNADTRVTRGWVERLLRHLRCVPSVGLICPVTNHAGNEAKIQAFYQNAEQMEQFALEIAKRHMGERTELTIAPLFCAAISRRVWCEIGPLDERYEIGMFEDDDFSYRLRHAGYRIAAAEDCFIHHFGQGSFSQMRPESYNRIFEENRRKFEAKWNIKWEPHRTRPGVRPAFGEERHCPAAFVGRTPRGDARPSGSAEPL